MMERAGITVMLNELSSTVVFERPLDEVFVRKWQLACEGDIAHVVVMPNITLTKLETFMRELIESRWAQRGAGERRAGGRALCITLTKLELFMRKLTPRAQAR